jgi:hemolysin-activating ACP:hemolysin acyltransferase
MDYTIFGKVMELVHLDPYYNKTTTSNHTNSIYYAVKHNKLLTHWNEDTLLGFCTYGFFTQDELDSDIWDGDEAYARSTGDVLFFPKFQCRAGRREVVRFIRQIQTHLSDNYPDRETAEGLRVYPEGNTRNELWHRKAS